MKDDPYRGGAAPSSRKENKSGSTTAKLGGQNTPLCERIVRLGLVVVVQAKKVAHYYFQFNFVS
ncbi:MAG: hypothetical protein N3D85_03440 [Candidatus Bathyarchaeota archaeon]|nr:hypothetical protein [Candidatus Bathyarchaeota archaeon]